MLQKLFDSRTKARDNESGFTLIELLVVIVILGILAAVVVFAVSGISDKGQSSACAIDSRTLKTGEEAFFATPENDATGGKKTTPAGVYGSMADLVSEGFLQAASTYHTITPPAGTTFPDGTAGNTGTAANAGYNVNPVVPCTV